ncbi:MAG: GNAT family N-acetyltransferase [Ramlibacter sp.]
MPALATGDLLLEPLVAAHAEAMFAVLSDPALFRFIDGAPPASVHELRQRYARLESRVSPDGRQRWLNWVLRPQGGAPAGFVQATVEPDGQAWVAYLLGQQHQGRGVATRAVEAMLPCVHAAHGAHRFLAQVEADNTPSLRLLARLRFGLASREEHELRGLGLTERLFARDALSPPASP